MELNLDRVRDNVLNASTEDLLDRATVYRREMEPEALTIIDEALMARGVTRDDIAMHLNSRQGFMARSDGTPIKCGYNNCHRPAWHEFRHWHKLFGIVPIFRETMRVCDEHRRDTEKSFPVETNEEPESA